MWKLGKIFHPNLVTRANMWIRNKLSLRKTEVRWGVLFYGWIGRNDRKLPAQYDHPIGVFSEDGFTPVFAQITGFQSGPKASKQTLTGPYTLTILVNQIPLEEYNIYLKRVKKKGTCLSNEFSHIHSRCTNERNFTAKK